MARCRYGRIPFTAYHHRTKAGYGARTKLSTRLSATLATAQAHYGNQKDNLEKSFQEWGAKESARNKGGLVIGTYSVGGFKYRMNPYRLNFEFGGKRTEYNFASYSETQDVRPMTNALILKNDEAGIDGIQLTCSNRDYTNKRPKAELTVVTDVTSNICGTDKTLCAEGNVNVVGTGLSTTVG